MTWLVIIGFYSIWITPLIFVGTLIRTIQAIHEGESSKEYAIICAISFWLIIVPLFFAILEG